MSAPEEVPLLPPTRLLSHFRTPFAGRMSAPLDQLDAVAVRVRDERNFGAAVLHRAGFAHDLDPFSAQALAGPIDIGDADGKMAEGIAEVVVVRVPVVGQLDDAVGILVAVADEGERKTAARIILFAQQ